ncbi:LLM class F420-dependent oxidoreductase [Micromonospora sp. WMMA1363]|uniref:LLM class F420-dependent oxidoreductase n=1 Tax=Micromonospora sp. WMMA1363 TaxID=3053985 RepID=UPI00259D28FD|nr:LLM class F420-dependent oxidoreductase [Micromonospora sp. WMMA1363]MDM4721889.1 LLM class F420-dependent oxidoreductase [Micromonospora sp. WMMA1363]
MECHVFTNPQQGASYEAVAGTAKAVEDLGLDGFFRSDHFVAMEGAAGMPGPTDAWVTLGALARETRRIRLGTLMTAATFRHPGLLAVTVAQVDQMSNGRVDFGLGTGWHEPEHRAHGIPFPALGERFDRFEEQLAIITGLWETPPDRLFSHDGQHYQLVESPALPKPAQHPRPPVIVGGTGPTRTPRLAARYADEFNHAFPTLEEIATQGARVDAACEKIGRAPSTLRRSAAVLLVCGRDAADVARRSEDVGGLFTPHMMEHGLVGSPTSVVERIGAFADAGISRLYLQTPSQFDVDHLEYFSQHVLPQLRT